MSNNSVARTPGPWVNVGDSVNRVDDWEFIADCNGQNNDPNKDIANATFIVTACNAHNELVAALQKIASCTPVIAGDCPSIARAALAKVQL